MNHNEVISQLKPEETRKYETTLKTKLEFQCDNAMIHVETIDSERSECTTIQSKNAMYTKRSKFQFYYLSIIRDAMFERLQK